nr:ImmA/IrrE family metallo-endopeptidase [uncultured Microbacterium sp.]
MEHLLLLIEQYGLHVVERPGPTRGGFEPRTATIRITPGMSRRTTCSILAHELAHAVLGHDLSADPSMRDRQERQADEWAARLLIDSRAYAAAEHLRGAHIASLAFELGVTSELVIAYRRLLSCGSVPRRPECALIE